MVAGSSAAASNLYEEGLCFGSGPDMVYTFELSAPATVRAETHCDFDTKLALWSDPCGAEAGNVACNDDGGEGLRSLIQEPLEAGVYYLIFDGYSANAAGPFTMDVAVDPPDAIVR